MYLHWNLIDYAVTVLTVYILEQLVVLTHCFILQGLGSVEDEPEEESGYDDEILLTEQWTFCFIICFIFKIFVLSEVGKPIFASCGHEEQLCSLIALIQTFIMVVTSWNDSLKRIRSAHLQISFCYRSPLILCIVSRDGLQLDAQVDLILSIICRAQLVSIFQTKGSNFDLRYMFKGTGQHLNSIICHHRDDIDVFMRSILVFPMSFADREQFTNAIVSAVSSTKLSFLFLIIQLITVVRIKGVALYPCDLHLLINIIDCNPQFKHADNWIPVCLPHFNDTGFLYAYVSFIWEDSSACLLLLSLERSAFEMLHGVKEAVINKLHSSKSCVLLQNSNMPSDLWHFIYKNRCTSQMCYSQYSIPFINTGERQKLQKYFKKMFGYSVRKSNLKHLFVMKPECCLFSSITSNYELHCVLSPFVTRAAASMHVDRLLKLLKREESKIFITSNVYF
ncbi:unnamed protein product [Thelazia callipaeda]|uniref:Vacuolar fusion protein MON1 homolog n=1 Tax=Thelazia callipaeda TaxID=103827 RepID=A0A3P7MIX4_THECL|nr:unnamed protein product [Thelazia callipaeda]